MGGFGMAVGEALVYPPLNVAYCAAVLLEAGHEAAVVDGAAEGIGEEETLQRISALAPELIAINTSSASIELDMRVGAAAGKASGVPVVLLGSHVTHTPEYVLRKSHVDYAVRGEAEHTLLALVKALSEGKATDRIQGLSTWQGGEVNHHEDAAPILDLDDLPFPARHLLPQDLYGIPDMEKPFTTIQSSRGCPLNCSYCGYTLAQGLKWRGRSAENVVEEMAQVHDTYGIRNLVFRDPLFSFKMDRVAEICRLLEGRGLDMKWQCETAIRYLEADLLEQMGRSGCVSVSLGVESADPEIQKKYSRGKLKSKEHALSVVRACRKAGIRTRIFFMLGFPEDTRDTVRATVELARELNPDSVQFTAVTPYPGTQLHESLKDRMEIAYEDLWGYKPVGICENLSDAELEQEIKRAYRLFYMRPGRLLKALADPGALARRIRRYLGLYR
jgi:anaerobic magnesium-protoporphyrin IX monomethyl ester cyclase